ncbi:hypothetical protein LEP1GSC084_0167 [Leptospira interrogans serovar Medanensis str. L0448]|nr:hypothetical protein LEP1GSC084_0167 [Leptospira interrogans serovar Medanensis str. L0448]
MWEFSHEDLSSSAKCGNYHEDLSSSVKCGNSHAKYNYLKD